MRRDLLAALALALLLVFWPTGRTVSGQTNEELPLHTQKLSDRVLFAWVGDAMQTIRVVALSTARGVVIIEAIWTRLGGPATGRG